MLFKKKKQSLKDFADTAEGRELSADELNLIVGGNDILNRLQERNVKDLNIEAADNISVSYVVAGKTYATTFPAALSDFTKLMQEKFLSGQNQNEQQSAEKQNEQQSMDALQKQGGIIETEKAQVYTANTGPTMVLTAKTSGVVTEIESFHIGVNDKDGAAKANSDSIAEAFTSVNSTRTTQSEAADIQIPTGGTAEITEAMRNTNLNVPGSMTEPKTTTEIHKPEIKLVISSIPENSTETEPQTTAEILENLKKLAGKEPQTSQEQIPPENIHFTHRES